MELLASKRARGLHSALGPARAQAGVPTAGVGKSASGIIIKASRLYESRLSCKFWLWKLHMPLPAAEPRIHCCIPTVLAVSTPHCM